jgi:adenine deaminase
LIEPPPERFDADRCLIFASLSGARRAGSVSSRPIEAAYSWRQEDKIGSIAPGKIANFSVLEDDPYSVDPIKLKDIAIWGTIFEGAVYPVAQDKSKHPAGN